MLGVVSICVYNPPHLRAKAAKIIPKIDERFIIEHPLRFFEALQAKMD
jgi:hypothetical protein